MSEQTHFDGTSHFLMTVIKSVTSRWTPVQIYQLLMLMESLSFPDVQELVLSKEWLEGVGLPELSTERWALPE